VANDDSVDGGHKRERCGAIGAKGFDDVRFLALTKRANVDVADRGEVRCCLFFANVDRHGLERRLSEPYVDRDLECRRYVELDAIQKVAFEIDGDFLTVLPAVLAERDIHAPCFASWT